jgi:hypothetical protein
MSEHVEQPCILGGGAGALWAGVLGVPAVWGLQMQAAYALVPWVCDHRKVWLLHAVTIASLVIGAALFLIAWLDYRKTYRRQSDSLETGVHSRGRFLGALGLFVAAMFLLLIFAQGLPSLFIDPCFD